MSLESSRKSITSTPHAQRISSSFRSNEEFPITVEQLGKAMETELHAAEFTVPSLAEVAFPADVLTGIDGDLSAHIQWTSQSAHSEIGMAEWLNDLGTQLGAYFKCEVIRQWSSGCSSIEPSGSAIRRKPDLVLLDSPIAGQKVKWQTIRALGETTNEVVAPRRMTDTVKQKSFLIFVKQLDRCFVPSLSFTQSNFQFTICDRSGVVVTGFLPLERNKTCFLRILAGLMLTSDENIGYDTTMHHTSNGEIDSIRVQGVEYSVVKNLFMAKTIRGRATQCWQVSRGDEQFIIKDSWIATTRMSNEIDTLKHIQGIQCVPRFIAGEDVTLSNKKPNSTESRRQGITSFEENRVRRRLVTQPVAEPIESFSSKKELIGALLDIVKAHQDSYERSTLHRDVSLNNCMLWSDPQHPSMRRGLLNDFDYALRVDLQPNVPSPVHRTGTKPYMSLQVLRADCTQHLPPHDLESVFYVLLDICSVYKGPGLRRDDEDLKEYQSFPLQQWFELPTSNLAHFADSKGGTLSSVAVFERRFLHKFAPYFDDLKPCMIEFYKALFPENDAMTVKGDYSDVIPVLERALESLPEPDEEPQAVSAPNTDRPTVLLSSKKATKRTPRHRAPSTITQSMHSSGSDALTGTTLNGSVKRSSTGTSRDKKNRKRRGKSSHERSPSIDPIGPVIPVIRGLPNALDLIYSDPLDE